MTPTLTEFYSFWKAWFAQPLAEKMKLSKQVTGKSGYMPFESESPGFTGQKDPKEYFHWKASDPAHPDSGGHDTATMFAHCYYTAISWLREHGLEELIRACPPANHVLRIIHYPAHPTGCVGEAHRDFDLLTVSVEGTAPGLEVFESRRAEDGGLISGWTPQEVGIQVGEMLELYVGANDVNEFSHLQATTHRVRTPPNTDRLKAVFFYLPPMDFELRPGFTAHDYLLKPGSGVLLKAGTSK